MRLKRCNQAKSCIPTHTRKRHFITVLYTFSCFAVASSLYVDPESIAEPEGDEQVHFFCQENQGGSQASGITWRGPNGDLYTPGEATGDERINVEGYRLTLYDVVRGDSGTYECFRGSTESAAGQLLVYGE